MSVDLHIHPDFREVLETNGLDAFGALMDSSLGQALDKPGLEPWRRRRRISLRDCGGAERIYYLKCYEDPPPARRWRRLLGGVERASGLAACEMAQIDALGEAGVPTMRWAAWGQELDGQRERRSFVLTEAVPGDALERWLPEVFARMSPAKQRVLKPSILRSVAELVRRFHGAGLVHRDLYASHVFIDLPGADRIDLHLIDVQRVFKPRRLKTRWRVKDLAQLNYSTPAWFAGRTDRLRFLRFYLGTRKLTREHKRLIARIMGKSARIARHDARRTQRQAS